MQAIAEPMPQTLGLRNIHFREERRAASSGPTNEEYRKVNRSPNEEFTARVMQHGSPKKFPQSVIALILQKQKHITVTKTGIKFDYQGNKFQFWSPTSLVCANQVDQRVLVTFDPDAMDFCHVLTDDGRFVESIPQKNKVAWFDDEAMRQAMKDKAYALNRDIARYRDIQQATSEEKATRILSNAEKMQIVNTFPVEDRSQKTEVRDKSGSVSIGVNRRLRSSALPSSRLSTGFDRAEQITGAVSELRRQSFNNTKSEVSEAALRKMAEAAIDDGV
jgi:hypothetical protein